MKDLISNTPLTRRNVTSDSRILLPSYVAFFLVIGANYMTISHSVAQDSPALRFADGFLYVPIWGWGTMFVSCGLLLLGALLTHLRDLSRLALWIAVICMGIWTITLLGASIFGGASPAAAAWPLFVAIACFATERSLTKEEVS